MLTDYEIQTQFNTARTIIIGCIEEVNNPSGEIFYAGYITPDSSNVLHVENNSQIYNLHNTVYNSDGETKPE